MAETGDHSMRGCPASQKMTYLRSWVASETAGTARTPTIQAPRATKGVQQKEKNMMMEEAVGVSNLK